jgi:hypothetical protein
MPDGRPEDEPDALGATLADLLDDLAREFEDVERRQTPTGVGYSVRTKAFAHRTGRTASYRLRPEIAAAAARTSGASGSGLGAAWVSFSPALLDQYALDRLQSWFELAHRLAADEPTKAH